MADPKVSYKWLVAVAFVAGLFMDLMDATIVNVALPTLSRDFEATTDTLEWVVTGYLISLAIWTELAPISRTPSLCRQRQEPPISLGSIRTPVPVR